MVKCFSFSSEWSFNICYEFLLNQQVFHLVLHHVEYYCIYLISFQFKFWFIFFQCPCTVHAGFAYWPMRELGLMTAAPSGPCSRSLTLHWVELFSLGVSKWEVIYAHLADTPASLPNIGVLFHWGPIPFLDTLKWSCWFIFARVRYKSWFITAKLLL